MNQLSSTALERCVKDVGELIATADRYLGGLAAAISESTQNSAESQALSTNRMLLRSSGHEPDVQVPANLASFSLKNMEEIKFELLGFINGLMEIVVSSEVLLIELSQFSPEHADANTRALARKYAGIFNELKECLFSKIHQCKSLNIAKPLSNVIMFEGKSGHRQH